MSARLSYVVAVIILLIGSAFRMWQITTLPAGLSDEEMTHVSLMRESIYAGDIRVFYEQDGAGQEGIYHIILSLATVAFGMGTVGLRFPSLIASIIHIALIYTLGVRLYGRWAGIAAATLISVMLWDILLARLVLAESIVPIVLSATLLALARAMPVYTRTRASATNTQDFALLGILLGFSLYIHPAGLMMVLTAMTFIIYIILTRRPLSLRWLSYIGFSILLLIIVAMPYLISTIRLETINASSRIFGDYGSLSLSVLDGFIGLLLRGDANPAHNLPLRPLVDIVSGFFVLLGFCLSIYHWRRPRYALPLIATLFLAPLAVLTDNSPNFIGFTLVLPLVALFFGLAISTLLSNLPPQSMTLALMGLALLIAYNIVSVSRDLFFQWQSREDVELVYNADIGRIAHYVDTTAADTPTVLCHPFWDIPNRTELSAADEVILLMNHDTAPLHFVDCRTGFLFVNAGEQQQVIIPDSELLNEIPADIVDWLALGQSVTDAPERTVILMEVEQELANELGIYTTTAPASYVTESDVSERIPIPPPIRFGGNLTWLGYQNDPAPFYETGEFVPVTTYWRVEDGEIPSDARIFTHILSDPVTVAANVDLMSVNPAQLNERDIFMQTVSIPLSDNIPPGAYEISVGAYEASDSDRLQVLVEGEVRGNRIFLYSIEVFTP